MQTIEINGKLFEVPKKVFDLILMISKERDHYKQGAKRKKVRKIIIKLIMSKKKKLKDLKKIHKLENKAFEEKLHMGFKFLADVGETLARNFAVARNANGEPIHHNMSENMKFDILLREHFSQAGADIIECTGSNFYLCINKGMLHVSSKSDAGNSMYIGSIEKMSSEVLEALINFVKNA